MVRTVSSGQADHIGHTARRQEEQLGSDNSRSSSKPEQNVLTTCFRFNIQTLVDMRSMSGLVCTETHTGMQTHCPYISDTHISNTDLTHAHF